MNDEREIDRTQERLLEAWRSTPAPALPRDWKAGVMRDVHSATPAVDGVASQPVSAFERAVRLGAIAATLLALAAIGTAIATGVQPDEGLLVMLRSSPESLLEWILVL